MREYTREDLLALTPERYLADGFLDASGQARPELRSDWATAASTQLLATAELSPQEFAFTYEALGLALQLEDDGPALERAVAGLDEALEVVGRMIRQPNNEGLERWLEACVAHVSQPADIDALLGHVQATMRQYAMFAALPAPDSSSSSAPS